MQRSEHLEEAQCTNKLLLRGVAVGHTTAGHETYIPIGIVGGHECVLVLTFPLLCMDIVYDRLLLASRLWYCIRAKAPWYLKFRCRQRGVENGPKTSFTSLLRTIQPLRGITM